MYKLFIEELFYGAANNKAELKKLMDDAVLEGYAIEKFEVFQRKAHVTYTVSESKLVID